MGKRTLDSDEACRLWRCPIEHMNVHPFEARQGSSDIQNHPGHTHMQIGFFFLQCRTSTRHGRSTTGNGKTDLKSPWWRSKSQNRNQHPQKQPQQHTSNTTHHKKPRNKPTSPGRLWTRWDKWNTHMQIGGTEVAALGHQAWVGSRGAWHHNERYTTVDQWLPWLVQCCISKASTSPQQWGEAAEPCGNAWHSLAVRPWPVEKEKASLACWPHLLRKQPAYLVAKNRGWGCQAVQGSLRLHIKR